MKEEISSSFNNTSNASSAIDEENYLDMPFLETEEEAAENIADINEQRDVRKKDNKASTFAPPDNTEEAAENIVDINEQRDTRKDDTSEKEINLNDINDLVNKVYNYARENNHVIIDNINTIYFSDLISFLNDIKDGEINNSNKKKAYEDRIKKIEI